MPMKNKEIELGDQKMMEGSFSDLNEVSAGMVINIRLTVWKFPFYMIL